MLNGIINIYKERGFTSHDVVAKLRGITKQKKIGHTGTLDPDAEGVLPVCFGKATKLCDLLTDKDKTYEAVLRLGVETDTQDMTGTVLESHLDMIKELDSEKITRAILEFVGTYEQVPPMYSALKVNGKKLYELARQGIEVERKARLVSIYHIDILEINLPTVRMSVHCSKGTYIRTLCHDIGKKLGCGGCMESLLRTQVERFCIKDSHRFAELPDAESVKRFLLPIDTMFEGYPAYTVAADYTKWLYNGAQVLSDWVEPVPPVEGRSRLYDSEGNFIGLYLYDRQTNAFRLEKMFKE
jgi:tRNA pseudouridine55 synthase